MSDSRLFDFAVLPSVLRRMAPGRPLALWPLGPLVGHAAQQKDRIRTTTPHAPAVYASCSATMILIGYRHGLRASEAGGYPAAVAHWFARV